jgi:hypothetical protein
MKFIFEIQVKPEYTVEQYAKAWIEASEIIQRAPGARGTRLHRKIGSPDTALAIASWQTKSDRDAMENRHDPQARSILDSQAQYVEFRLIGEYEEPEWVVLPPTGEC